MQNNESNLKKQIAEIQKKLENDTNTSSGKIFQLHSKIQKTKGKFYEEKKKKLLEKTEILNSKFYSDINVSLQKQLDGCIMDAAGEQIEDLNSIFYIEKIRELKSELRIERSKKATVDPIGASVKFSPLIVASVRPTSYFEAPVSSSRYNSRCQATTLKGAQCKRSSQSGSKYCWQH